MFPLQLIAALGVLLGVPLEDPRAVAEELLAADRAFSRAGAESDVVTSLSAMFADDVIMPAQGGSFVEGRAAVAEYLRRNPENLTGRVEWTPVRAGVSADARHGFTFGFMTLTAADGTVTPLKYLSYWVRTEDGWRVAAYKRRPRPEGEISLEPLAPALPPRLVDPVTDSVALERLQEDLAAAEQAFSDDAQEIGLGPAFARYGSADAMNMGGPDAAGFVLGAENIARAVSGGEEGPSPVSWSADRVLVASSGDLGLTFGVIRVNVPVEAQTSAFAFFTVWRRAGPGEPWRYVAE